MKKYFILLLFVFSFNFSHAQLTAVVGKTDYHFWINLPEKEVLDNKPPILIFLHGRSLSGTDINKVRRYGVLRAMDKGKKIPAIVIAPQVASGPWNPDKVLEILNYVQKNYKTDLSRVYVCGMSLGSYGTMAFVGKYPDRVTAAVSICGGGLEKDACNLAKVPLWIQHGDKDFIVPLTESKKIVKAILNYNPAANLIFTIIPGGNHGNVEHLFRENAIYDWMFKQVKVLP